LLLILLLSFFIFLLVAMFRIFSQESLHPMTVKSFFMVSLSLSKSCIDIWSSWRRIMSYFLAQVQITVQWPVPFCWRRGHHLRGLFVCSFFVVLRWEDSWGGGLMRLHGERFLFLFVVQRVSIGLLPLVFLSRLLYWEDFLKVTEFDELLWRELIFEDRFFLNGSRNG